MPIFTKTKILSGQYISMDSKAIFYQYWSSGSVERDLRHPILYSLITARKIYPEIPIYLFDYGMTDWTDHLERLKIIRIPRSFSYEKIISKTQQYLWCKQADRFNPKLAFRWADLKTCLKEIQEDYVLRLDADFLCLNPMMRNAQRPVVSTDAGIFYGPREHYCWQLLSLIGNSVLFDENFRSSDDFSDDSAIIKYSKNFQEFDETSELENLNFYNLPYESVEPYFLHLRNLGQFRGRMAIYLEEVYPWIEEYLGVNKISEIFNNVRFNRKMISVSDLNAKENFLKNCLEMIWV